MSGKVAQLNSARLGWRYVATFNVRAFIKCTALRLHLSGVSSCFSLWLVYQTQLIDLPFPLGVPTPPATYLQSRETHGISSELLAKLVYLSDSSIAICYYLFHGCLYFSHVLPIGRGYIKVFSREWKISVSHFLTHAGFSPTRVKSHVLGCRYRSSASAYTSVGRLTLQVS